MEERIEISSLKFDLLENGLDYVLNSLDPIVKPENHNLLKYSILHLSSGVELILKERLRQEHWTLIFSNVNSANTNDLKSGDFQSVNFEDLISRLENICGISFPEKEKRYLRELKKRRNRIEHFEFNEIDTAVKSLTSKVLSIIFSFITESFPEEILSENSKTQIQSLRKKVKDFDEFTSLRLAQISDTIEKAKKEHDIIKCPMCYQMSFVLSEDLKCLFCGYTDIPEIVASSYIENILGINAYLELKDGGYFPLETCFDCGDDAMVDDGDYFICFNCLLKWPRASVNECSGCGQLYLIDSVEDIDVCEACMTYRIERFE